MTLWFLLLTGLFQTKSAASRRMGLLEARGEAMRMKNVLLSEVFDGKAQACWCNAPCKQDNQIHNAYVVLVLALYYPHLADVVCGYDTDAALRPDATFTLGGERFHLEMFMGRPHMGRAQVQARMRAYLGDPKKDVPRCADTVLIVSTSEPAKRRLLDWCKELGELAYVATIQDLVKDRYGAVWTGMDGLSVAINVDGNVHGYDAGNVNGP